MPELYPHAGELNCVAWSSALSFRDHLETERTLIVRFMQATGDSGARQALIGIWRIILVAFVVAALYLGQSVFVPLALAFLLTFVLSPVVTWLQRWIGKTSGILLVVTMLFMIVGGSGWLLGRQLFEVGAKIPDYKLNLADKLRAFRIPSTGALARLSGMIEDLKKELPGRQAPPERAEVDKLKQKATEVASPVPVRVVESAEMGIAQLAQRTFVFLLGPLGKMALVLLLLIFMLFEREDLRGRLIRVISQGDIRSTTQALDDAGSRLSHYLRLQLLVNVAYGTSVAVGLLILGIPNAVLWGALSGLLRYIPYIGVWIGAAAPIALSLAISSNWYLPIFTFGLFVFLELIYSNFVEPWLYGVKTGITPVALIVGAIFWTWIWGAIGLLLTTPLMVCLVVLGRHVPSVRFLSILFSDQKALLPHEEFYIRLLAVDPDEPSRFMDEYLDEHSLTDFCDTVIVPSIILIETDYRRGTLNESQKGELYRRLREIIEDMGVHPTDRSSSFEELSSEPETAQARRFLSLPAHTEPDELAARTLSRLLVMNGFIGTASQAKVSDEALLELIEKQPVEAVFITVVAPSTTARARYKIEKIRSRFPKLKIGILLLRGVGKEAEPHQSLRDAGADAIFPSLAQGVEWFVSQHRQESSRQEPQDKTLPPE